MQLIFQILLAVVAIFLILLVLVQRGRGGGLAGALGGMGGSSAFGAKAGDVFTRITIVAAAVWIILCIAAAKLGPATAGSRLKLGTEGATTTLTNGPDLTAPAAGEKVAGEPASAGGAGEKETEPAAGDPPASKNSVAGGEKASEPASSNSAPGEPASAGAENGKIDSAPAESKTKTE